MRTLRGAPDQVLLVYVTDPSLRLEADRLYLIRGTLTNASHLVPFPEMTDFAISDYLDNVTVATGDAARREARFLESTKSGATILGHVSMRGDGDGRVEGEHNVSLGGVRVMAASGVHTAETTVAEDGHFVFAGVPRGTLELRLSLPPGFAVTNASSLSFEVGEGGCKRVTLEVSLNGRVRGRILNASDVPLDAVTVSLDAGIASGGPGIAVFSSNAHRFEARPTGDGRFEFGAVPPGSYVLSARLAGTTARPEHRATFFPGTNRLEEVIRVEVGRATEHDGFDFAITTDEVTLRDR